MGGMNQLLDDPTRPLSVWTVNSDEDTYVSGLREAETVSEPLVTKSLALIDPPLQFDDILNRFDPREIKKREAAEADTDKTALLQKIDKYCRPADRKESQTVRLAPSTDCESQQVNTVEIVKKDGNYSVVLDGVSQGVIGSSYDPVTGQLSFDKADYWLPRFKEAMVRDDRGQLVRTTQPVIFSMRLEDYEGVPESCNVHVLQRVVNGGTVIMDNKEVKKEKITPYSTGSAASEVVVLPYPLISTPEPHFYINDYSRMREAEIMVKISQDVGLLNATRSFLGRVAGSVTPGSGESGPGMLVRDLANWIAAAKQAAGQWLTSAAGAAGAGAAVSTGVAGVAAATEAASAATGAAGAAASALGATAPVVAPALIGGAVGGLGVFMVWEMLSSSRKLEKWTVTAADRERLLGMHERECVKEPMQHRISISELPKILRRISETRANGSVISGTDQTVGMSVHDLSDRKWRKEAAFLQWIQYGEGPRFDGSSQTARQTATAAATLGIVATAAAGAGPTAAVASSAFAAQATTTAGVAAAAVASTPFALAVLAAAGLSYALMWRTDEWVSSIASYQTPPDPITGRYKLQQNIQHNNDLRERPQLAPLTGNTISRAGMDPLTLSNTRTQFAFTIKIVESDGRPGPTINIESTRLNGIDAGWVSAGYDNLVNVIRQEVDCLEFKLMSLPGVTSWMRSHSTLVADSNNGSIVGDKFDMQVNQAIDRELGDISGAVNTPEKLREAAEREKKRSSKTAKDLEKSRKALAKANQGVATVKNDQRRLDEKYNQKVVDINNDPNLNAARRARKLATARQTYDNGKQRLATRLGKRRQTAVEKDEDAIAAARINAAQNIRESRAGSMRKLANIIDYEALLKRIRADLLGDEYDIYTLSDAAGGIEQMREQRVSQRTYWTRIKDALLPMAFRSADAEDITAVRGTIEEHKEYCISSLSKSLGVRSGVIVPDSVLHLRFTEIFSPVVTTRRQQSMRFASFIVPGVGVWLRPPTRAADSIVRMLPQIVVFSTSLVSAFGNVKILQPLSLASSELVEEQTDGKNSVRVADLTLRRISNLYDVPRMLIWQNVCHLIQVYERKANWVAGSSTVFSRSLDTARSSADLMAMAALPTKAIRKQAHVAVSAGGDNMKRHNYVTAGTKVYGAGKLLAELGCERGHGGLLAVATFSEILAFHVLQYGSSVSGGSGFLLQYRELIDNVKSKSRQAAQIVARFITTYYTSTAKKPRRMVFNDVAFYCLPGMSYVRIALRRIGLLEDLDRSNTVFVEWNSYDRQFANDFATSLLKLASSNKIDPSVFPFTCAQSVGGGVPVAIKSRMGEDYADSASAQIATLCHAYKRVQIMTDAVKPVSGDRNVVCIRVDCICSRPIVLKTAAMYRQKTLQIIERVNGTSPQSSWSKPKPQFNSILLNHRLAGMRMTVEEDVLKRAVETPAMFGKTSREVYDELVDSMADLDVRGLVTIREPAEATFMIPFGVYSMGTTADIACMDFEMRPVWVADLKEAALRARLACLTPSTTTTEMTVRMDGPTIDGRPRHPFAIIASKDVVSVYVDTELSKNAAATGPSPVDPVDTDLLVEALSVINKDPVVSEMSGEISESYRSVMHNAERVFQACLVIASGRYHDKPPAKGIVAQVDLQTGVPPPANLVVSVCIGNALAYAATGLPIRIGVSSPTQDSQRHQDMALAALAVENACEALIAAGVAAVPFSEACCSLSCLSV